MHSPVKRHVLPVCLTLLLVTGAAASEIDDATKARPKTIKKREPTEFIRVERDEYENPVGLQTATARYWLRDDAGQVKLEVCLESVVHFADAAYYRGFEQRFRHYDAVLYELVAPEGKRIPSVKSERPNFGRLWQQLTAGSLGFAYQIDAIDYQTKNMVHSDLSPAEMAELKQKRGEDDFTMLADMLLDLSRRLNRAASAGKLTERPPVEVGLDVLTDPNGAVRLRRLLASTFEKGSPAAALNPAQAASLILDRNERAMQVFQEQLDQGERKIALFWGAAHMPDLEKRLILDYGVQPAEIIWRNAWDLRDGAVKQAPLESILGSSLRDSIENTLKELLESGRK